ncbi:hypothetical protein OPV22_004219 [Ensete ventricosum]|uniref:Association with the SNF1 complex (ASC) domain-containing protein n=1 Tax=Ensete ventricosum TaxID=4639 RepID=A0AAV8S346_ENSVE|nr:hypothetical protein OPV22_004219 [Ensete ventricosum]
MDRPNGNDHEGVSVAGFEVPRSPDSSYNNPVPGNEDEAREPPLVPPHLHHTLLNYPPSQDDPSSLSVPQNVVLNHLYIENREGPRSVVAMGITHRFRSKYVTVVLYKPVQRR